MRLLIVRHGDPDYSIDSLTPKGWKEAELLADRLCKLDVKAFYVSPLGRAKDTASFTLKRLGREAEEMKWMREFDAQIDRPDAVGRTIVWDWLPADWTNVPIFYDKEIWSNHPLLKTGKTEHGDVRAEYDWVIEEFDKLLARHGYQHQGQIYRAVNANNDTIVLFCHFGLECVLLSHLLGISPMVLWHGFCAAPTRPFIPKNAAGALCPSGWHPLVISLICMQQMKNRHSLPVSANVTITLTNDTTDSQKLSSENTLRCP